MMVYNYGNLRFKFIIVVVVVIIVIFVLNHGRVTQYTNVISQQFNCTEYIKKNFKEDNSEQYLKLIRHIIRAHRYSRSGKTIHELSEAFKIVQTLLEKTKNETVSETLEFMNGRTVNSTNVKEEPEVCPEIYKGMKYGYPYYYTGYITDHENCIGQPLGSIVTVLVNLVGDSSVEDLGSIVNGFKNYFPNITIIVGHSQKQNISTFVKYNHVLPLVVTDDRSGTVWKKMAQKATSKYVFIAKQLLRVDNHTSIERLLRFLSYQTADVVGTSHRYIDGRWFRGCHTTALRNYTLKFVDGYDLSYNSCIYCDYLTGPFVIGRETFINNVDDKLHGDPVFVDMFTKMSQDSKTILSCPDVLVTIQDRELHSLAKSDWLPFIRKWELNRLVFTDRQELRFTCAESKLSCPWKGGLIMPICCIQELADMMKFIAKTFSENNMVVELEGGSNIGAAKSYGIMPYERDADFDWLVTDHVKLASLKKHFKDNGYQLIEDDKEYDCLGNMSIVNCGYFGVKNSHWRIEMWGTNYLGSDESIRVGFENRTKIMIDGMWITSLHSPAASARNEYGDDLYQHIEHWITLGYNTGWVQPKTGAWLPCPRSGFHGCLSMYLPVGDIQFKDVWI